MLVRVAEGRKMYIYTQYAVIALFTTMNVIALIFILVNCIPVEYGLATKRMYVSILISLAGPPGTRVFLRTEDTANLLTF